MATFMIFSQCRSSLSQRLRGERERSGCEVGAVVTKGIKRWCDGGVGGGEGKVAAKNTEDSGCSCAGDLAGYKGTVSERPGRCARRRAREKGRERKLQGYGSAGQVTVG